MMTGALPDVKDAFPSMTIPLSVIIPAYNEEDVILATIDEVVAALGGLELEVLIVDDGSVDNTFQRVEQRAATDPRIRALRYEANRGKGFALKHGFNASTGKLVAFIDADLDIHPQQIANFRAILEETKADVVIGSKLHPRSRLDYPWHRRVISRVYFWLVRLLFGLPVLDTQTGVKLFRRNVLLDTLPYLTTDGFAFDLELLVLAHKLEYKIVDAPVVLTFQRGKWGRIGAKAIGQVLRDTIRVYRRSHDVTPTRTSDTPPSP